MGLKVNCHSVIVATGATARRLSLPREDEFWSRGISACAICDGASPLFKGQVLAVVGGGDTATEEALYLTKYGRHVHLLVRRDQLRASKAMQDSCYIMLSKTAHLILPLDVYTTLTLFSSLDIVEFFFLCVCIMGWESFSIPTIFVGSILHMHCKGPLLSCLKLFAVALHCNA
ncbi:hypothetical protein CsSME_00045722 [Camellia sinensis var. sinensis]